MDLSGRAGGAEWSKRENFSPRSDGAPGTKGMVGFGNVGAGGGHGGVGLKRKGEGAFRPGLFF